MGSEFLSLEGVAQLSDYKALTGIDYPDNETGEPVRVEKGGKISNMGDAAVENELAAGNIEPWTEDDPIEKGGDE